MGFMHTIQGFHWGLLDGVGMLPPLRGEGVRGGILGDGGGIARKRFASILARVARQKLFKFRGGVDN